MQTSWRNTGFVVLFAGLAIVMPMTLFFSFPSACQAAAQSIVGRKFWLAGSFEREFGPGIEWIIVTSDAQPMHYDLKLSTGKTDIIRKDWLDDAIKREAVVDYDPVAKRQEQIRSRKWPAHIERAVIGREVMIGMTTEQVTLAWGKPNRIHRTVGAWGRHEQWIYIYRDGTSLYFQNDVLTSYHEEIR